MSSNQSPIVIYDFHFKFSMLQFKTFDDFGFPYQNTKIVAELVDFDETAAKDLELTGRLNSNEKPRNDVTFVSFGSELKNFTRVPINLLQIFPEMETLRFECPIKKVCRDDLKAYKNLKEIRFIGTEIEELPDDLFEDLKKLEVVIIAKNKKLSFIDKNIFKNLQNLKFADLSENSSIDLVYAVKGFKCDKIWSCDDVTRIFKLEKLNEMLEKIYPSTAIKDLQRILKDETFKDLTVKIEEESFKVHKLMLAARSPTLAEMIKNNPDADELILVVEVEVFKIILEFIYEDKIPEKFDEKTEKIFEAAEKLKLEELKVKYGKILCGSVTSENALDLLKIACKNHLKELQLKTFEQIKKNFPNRTLSDNLMKNPEAVERLLIRKRTHEDSVKEAKAALKKMKVDFEIFLDKFTVKKIKEEPSK